MKLNLQWSDIKNARQRKRMHARLTRWVRIVIKRFNGRHDWAMRGYLLEARLSGAAGLALLPAVALGPAV